jgi:hypothetical protein
VAEIGEYIKYRMIYLKKELTEVKKMFEYRENGKEEEGEVAWKTEFASMK